MNDKAVTIVIFIMCCFLLNGELLLGQQVEYAGVKIEGRCRTSEKCCHILGQRG